jgi:hypothetical protein
MRCSTDENQQSLESESNISDTTYRRENGMKGIYGATLVAMIVFFFAGVVYSQDARVSNRSSLEFNVGIWTGPKMGSSGAYPGYMQTSDFSSPFEIELLWAYPVDEQISATLSFAAFAGTKQSSVDVLGMGSTIDRAGFIAPVILGVRYLFPPSISLSALRPFISAGVGLENGYEITIAIGSPRSWNLQRALAFRIGTGTRYSLTGHVDLLLKVEYIAGPKFAEPVGQRSEYNGVSVSIGTGLTL